MTATRKTAPATKPFRRVLVLPDIHVPYEDKRSLAAVEAVMADHPWDEIVQLGDFIDFDCISAHNDGKPGLTEGKTLADDFAAANRVLDRWQRLAPNAQITLLEGNHEERVLRYLQKYPPLRGQIEVPINLRLKERGIRWVPSWSKGKLYQIGNAFFHHGKYLGQNHAKQMAMFFGASIYYGHVHDISSYSYAQRAMDKVIVGQSLGCLCLPQNYMQGGPMNLQQGFGAFTFFDDGYYTPNIVRIFKHRFAFEGKVYRG